MSLKLPICDFCKHQHENVMKCDAFPHGIPGEKMRLSDDGKECANGVYFEPENPEDWANDFLPEPDSLLEKFGRNII